MGLWRQGDGRAEGGPAEARLGHAAVAAAAEEGARLRRLPPAQDVCAPDVASGRGTGGDFCLRMLTYLCFVRIAIFLRFLLTL